MLTESNLRCFITLAETLNFTRTAKLLYMSQQAVSQHIARLEEDFGFPLFVRTRRSVSLTKSGQKMYDFWSKTFQEYSLLQEQCHALSYSHRGAMRIGYQDWMNFGPAVNTALNRLEDAHPSAVVESVRHSPNVLLQRLEEGDLDLVLIYKRFIHEADHLNQLDLMSTPIMLMISPTNQKVMAGGSLDQLIEEPFVMDAFPNEPYADALRRAKWEIAMYNLKPSKVIVSSSRDSAYTEAELGRGYVISTGVSRISSSSDLLKFPLGMNEHIVCLWNPKMENPLVEEYVHLLKDAYQATVLSEP